MRPSASRDGGGAGDTSAHQRVARAETLAEELPPLLVAAERVAATVSQGVHGRRRVGQGETFWQFRRYYSGDSTQQIDWRQSAKGDSVFIRQTEWEAAQSVWLWRDGSASMHYRSSDATPTKLEAAEILLLALASLLVRGGEHVALVGAGLPPAPGRGTLRRMTALLERDVDAGHGVPPLEPLPRYGQLVLFSDCLTPLETLAATVQGYGARGVRGHIVRILDLAEEALPFHGRVLFQGCEDEGDLLCGRVGSIREAYQEAFRNHREGLEAIVRRAGWTLITHHTNQPPQAALLGLYAALSHMKAR